MVVISDQELPHSLCGGESSVLRQQASSSLKDSERKIEHMKTMDPEVWGNLPDSVAFEIYKKLPLRDFLRLREVCKEWNQLARERRCVTDPIHKPYFVLAQGKESNASVMLQGILTFHIKSSSWQWTSLLDILVSERFKYELLSVKGLTLQGFDLNLTVLRVGYRVVDVHSKSNYFIPRQPQRTGMPCALGMTVDTSVDPPTFKIIVGSLDVGTQIYDAVTRSWETRDSSLNLESLNGQPKFRSCLDCGNNLYIWSELEKILVYTLDEDKWSELNPPPRPKAFSCSRALGSWQGHIFAVTSYRRVSSDEGGNGIPTPFLWIWKLLVDHSEETLWEEVDKMPLDMQKWLVSLDDLGPLDESMEIHASFCEEHVLIYSWVREKCPAHRLVLHSLATKTWEKVEVPNHSMISLFNKNWNVRDLC